MTESKFSEEAQAAAAAKMQKGVEEFSRARERFETICQDFEREMGYSADPERDPFDLLLDVAVETANRVDDLLDVYTRVTSCWRDENGDLFHLDPGPSLELLALKH